MLALAMPIIVTPELTLEPLLVSHAEEMFGLLDDEAIYTYLDYSAPPSVDHLRNVYARLEARRSPDGSDAWLNWVIRPRDQPLVGYVQATVESNRSAYVAYVLASRYWGHGYAERAMQAMLEHLASAYCVHRCVATVEVENQRSIRLLERLGFHLADEHELSGHHLSTSERLFVRRFGEGAVMQVRELGPDDARVFQALRLAALRECPSAFASSYEEEHEISIAVVAERLVAKADRCVLGAWLGSDLVGMLGLKREEMRKLAHKAYIWGMYVAPRARRRGVGRELIAQALSRAASMTGVRQITLGVNAANAEAIALYEAAGFTSFGIERGFMLLDGVLHDEVMMVRNIETWNA